jgi:transcriptional regulator with XRE-family HTH domain
MNTKKRWPLIMARGNQDQAVIAEKVGVTQQTYSNWETGKSTPSFRKMAELSRVLGKPKKELFPEELGENEEFLDKSA